MDLKQIAKDTAKTLISYLTYQAVRTILTQLGETDPPVAYWLNNFTSRAKIQDSEAYLQALLRERPELAFRVLTVREHIAQEVADFLPEMVRSGVQQSNMDYRRQHLERMTQLSLTTPSSDPTSSSDAHSEPPTHS